MLDGLMRGPDAKRISEDVDHGNFHQAAQPHAAAHVIGKYEKGRAEWTHFCQAHAIDNRGHGVFANAQMQVWAAFRLGSPSLRQR